MLLSCTKFLLFTCCALWTSAQGKNVNTAEIFARPLDVISLSDMRFEPAVRGDGPQTVVPSGSFFAPNASFRIHGRFYASVCLSLPTDGVYMHRTNDRKSRIKVYDFKSIPTQGKAFRLSLSGEKNVFVGATRERIQKQHKAGFYNGTFLLTVAYQ